MPRQHLAHRFNQLGLRHRELRLGEADLGGEPLLKFNGDFKPEFASKNDGKEETRLPVKPRRDMVGNFLDVIRVHALSALEFLQA